MRDEYPSRGGSGKILVKEVEALVSKHAEAFARRRSYLDSDAPEGKSPIARRDTLYKFGNNETVLFLNALKYNFCFIAFYIY